MTGYAFVDFLVETYMFMYQQAFPDFRFSDEDREGLIIQVLETGFRDAVFSAASGEGFRLSPILDNRYT